MRRFGQLLYNIERQRVVDQAKRFSILGSMQRPNRNGRLRGHDEEGETGPQGPTTAQPDSAAAATAASPQRQGAGHGAGGSEGGNRRHAKARDAQLRMQAVRPEILWWE